MKRCLMIGSALLGIAAFATTAFALPPSLSSGASSIHNSLSSSLGDGRYNNWKKPYDSDDDLRSSAPKTTGKSKGGDTATGADRAPRRASHPRNSKP